MQAIALPPWMTRGIMAAVKQDMFPETRLGEQRKGRSQQKHHTAQ